MSENDWFKICKSCGDKIYYKTRNAYYANRHKNTQCRKCKHKHHSMIMMGRKRPPFTDKWKKNMAIAHKNSEVWKASMNTPEYKEKHRQKMLRMIREGKSSVAFNPRACDVFDFINQKMRWNGLHGKNDKEHTVDVFFLDYYEPSINIAIEWDEKHHKKPCRQKGDWIKQNVVMDTIKCEFYRVDDVTKTVKKVDKLPFDRTHELQRVINEYYENKT